jgi:hypothetical protein
MTKARKLFNCLAGELRHGTRPIGLENNPGACDVEPPGFQSLPFSMTTTSQYPRSVSSSANEHPTIPAPMITIFGISEPGFQ